MRTLEVVVAAAAAIGGTLLAVTGHGPASVRPPEATPPSRAIAITVDDLPGVSRTADLDAFRPMNAAMLAVLERAGVRATGFVNEGKLDAGGAAEHAARVALLAKWLDGGMGPAITRSVMLV